MDFSHNIMHTIQHIIKCEQDIMTMMYQMFLFLTIRQLWRSINLSVLINILVIYGWFFEYYRDWQKFIESHPDQVLIVYYEDMHKVQIFYVMSICIYQY